MNEKFQREWDHSSKDGGKEDITWMNCPLCRNKTRIRVRDDTVLIKFPLYCPKCKQENLINMKHFKISVIKEPDAKTQSR